MARMFRTEDSNLNLCDYCSNRKMVPECWPSDLEFGSGRGNDNIVACKNALFIHLPPYAIVSIYGAELVDRDE